MIYSIVGVVQEAQGYLNEKLPPECFKELLSSAARFGGGLLDSLQFVLHTTHLLTKKLLTEEQ